MQEHLLKGLMYYPLMVVLTTLAGVFIVLDRKHDKSITKKDDMPIFAGLQENDICKSFYFGLACGSIAYVAIPIIGHAILGNTFLNMCPISGL